jgi:hypothetical protein
VFEFYWKDVDDIPHALLFEQLHERGWRTTYGQRGGQVTAILDYNCSESHSGGASLHSLFLIYDLITQRVCLSLFSSRITDLTKGGRVPRTGQPLHCIETANDT